MHGTTRSGNHAHGKLELTGTAVEQHRTPGQERTTAPDLEMPKHGKENDGKQHVGGNTWAGGTGGSNTAGLGGRGGPYRLVSGTCGVYLMGTDGYWWVYLMGTDGY